MGRVKRTQDKSRLNVIEEEFKRNNARNFYRVWRKYRVPITRISRNKH